MPYPVKSPRWRQRTPSDQFIAITDAMEGCLDNFCDGIIEAKVLAERLQTYTVELKALLYFILNPKEW